MDTQTILTDAEPAKSNTVEFKIANQNEEPASSECSNGVCLVTWKPTRPAAA